VDLAAADHLLLDGGLEEALLGEGEGGAGELLGGDRLEGGGGGGEVG
jgi:hypothetical protein